MTTRSASTAVAFFAALLPACGSSGDEAAGIYDADALRPLVAQQEVRIGSVDDPDIGFSRIAGVEVGSDGSVYVLEAQDREIRVYDRAGTHVRTIGRPGSGPGEFERPMGFGLERDRLWVRDSRNQRITLFDTDGALIGTVPTSGVSIPVEIPGVTVRVVPAGLRPDGRFSSVMSMSMTGGGAITEPFSVPDLVFDSTGAVVDTLGVHSFAPGNSGMVRAGGLTMSVQSPLVESPIRYTQGADSVIIDRSIAAADGSADFGVVRVAQHGDTVFSTRFGYQPEPVASDFMDAVADRYLDAVSHIPVNQAEVETAVRAALVAPPYHPPVSSHHPGADGSVWLRRSDDASEYWRWIVLQPDGTPRGEVRLPRNATVQWTTADEAWLAEIDEFDVPWLVRYRITDGA